MIVDEAIWWQENVVWKLKPITKIKKIENGNVRFCIDGWRYDEQRYYHFDQVLDVIKRRYLEDVRMNRIDN